MPILQAILNSFLSQLKLCSDPKCSSGNLANNSRTRVHCRFGRIGGASRQVRFSKSADHHTHCLLRRDAAAVVSLMSGGRCPLPLHGQRGQRGAAAAQR